MTIRAVAGLIALNGALLGVGLAVLWGIRGWRWWTEALPLAGLAYFLGMASTVIALTCLLALEIPFAWWSLALTLVGLTSVGVSIGWRRGHRVDGLRPPGSRLRLSLSSCAGVAFSLAMLAYFSAFFLVARVHPAMEWDAWWVWTIRAKALYYFGDLGGAELVRGDYLSYPPGLSLLHASAFIAMGSDDVVTLHLLHWFFVVGFVAAVAGLYVARVNVAIFAPILLIAMGMPGLIRWMPYLLADFLLGAFVALAALQLALWFEKREEWRLLSVALLLTGALLTKRDALLYVGCLLLVSIVVSVTARRQVWPRIAALAVASGALASVWWFGNLGGQRGAAPSAGVDGFIEHSDRVMPALRLAGTAFLDPGLWSGVTGLAIIAVLIGAASGAWLQAAFVLSFTGLSVVGIALVLAAEPQLGLGRGSFDDPVERMLLVPVLVTAALASLLFQHAWRHGEGHTTT